MKTENKIEFPLGINFWSEVCQIFNKNGNNVWTLLKDKNGAVIGIQKLMPKSAVMSFKQRYGKFVTAGFTIENP